MKDNIKMDLKNEIHLAQVPVDIVMCLWSLPKGRELFNQLSKQLSAYQEEFSSMVTVCYGTDTTAAKMEKYRLNEGKQKCIHKSAGGKCLKANARSRKRWTDKLISVKWVVTQTSTNYSETLKF
jgi:hypothetical protein